MAPITFYGIIISSRYLLYIFPYKFRNVVPIYLFIIIFVFTIASLNLFILKDFINKGIREGNDVGSTARYLENNREQSKYNYVLATSHIFPYYSWGEKYQWDAWARFFIRENDTLEVLPPEALLNPLPMRPLIILTSLNSYQNYSTVLRNLYPDNKIKAITPYGTLVAIEIF